VFDWLDDRCSAILSGDHEMRAEAVRRSIDAKARIVEADPEDRTGIRALLNFGHTFAHAIESAAGLGSILHGEAVSVGMLLAFDFSVDLGLCASREAARVRDHLAGAGLPVSLAETGVDRSALLPLIGADKKNEGGQLRLILTRGIGEAFLARDVSAERLSQFLETRSS
jgi:3-dehydroquinate synthase